MKIKQQERGKFWHFEKAKKQKSKIEKQKGGKF